MATKQEVKHYIAHWFQLGKKVLIRNGQTSFLPQPVLSGGNYSTEFEQCWQTILALETDDCYLEGTHETIAELLNPDWEVVSCGRCAMPVPIRTMGMPVAICPCFDLSDWPNLELPTPRSPVNTQMQLRSICDRLLANMATTAI